MKDLAEGEGWWICKDTMAKGVETNHQPEWLTLGVFTLKNGTAIKNPWVGYRSFQLELHFMVRTWSAPNKKLLKAIMAQQWRVRRRHGGRVRTEGISMATPSSFVENPPMEEGPISLAFNWGEQYMV